MMIRINKFLCIGIMLALFSLSLGSLSALGESPEMSLTIDDNNVSISTGSLNLAIRLSDGTASVSNALGEPVMSLEYPSIMTFSTYVSDEIPIDESQYLSDLAKQQWEIISSSTGNTPEYGEFIEVTVGAQIDLDMPEIPGIPDGNPNIPIDLPEPISHWADIEIRYMVTERNATVQSPRGNSYSIIGQSQVKIDLKIIIDNQYSPETVCIKQNLVLMNQSHQLSIQTPTGDIPAQDSYGNISSIDDPLAGSDAAFKFGTPGENETGTYSWAGYSEIDGADVDIEDFYASTLEGLSLYFCYNMPQGANEIYHDPSITLNPEASGIVLPLPEVLSRYSILFLTVGIISGVVLAVASVARNHGKEDPMDLENNYYYKK